MKRLSMILSILAATAIVEALLAFRLWVQVTAQPIKGHSSLSAMALSRNLALPFRYVTGSEPSAGTGVIDFTLLTAMEGYFITMLGLLFLTFAFCRTTGWFVAHRTLAQPRFVVQEEGHRNRRPVLQMVQSRRHDGVRIYIRVDAAAAIVPHPATAPTNEAEPPAWA